ncbi:response regulator [Maritimibacter dapengensis]|uniref:Response regulator n=1 Tax=Maritimibacter dapengensis TaxID=2836868 RepID=A0ABS6SYR8_9RHOB|nr:response regulator [Maritimibacter dapengensis]MBV7377673.1 response regulator [Maritimibacter dapengensis]
MRLLAVDDDPIILDLLNEIIRSTTSYEVAVASNAQEALDLIDRGAGETFDCFLLDIQMPGMSGIELCREIRTRQEYRFAPILMLTAMAEKHYVDGAYSAGANDYITKPFEVTEINRRLTLAQTRATQLREEAARALQSDTPERYGILERIHIFDVDNVVDYVAMENYLPSLPKHSLLGSAALGIQIRGIEDIHENTSGFEFAGVIEDVAEAISDSLRDFQCLISYAGNGTFVTVIENQSLPARHVLADNVNLRLQKLGTHLSLPGQRPVRVICGDLVRLMHPTTERIQEALFQATASALQVANDTERNLEKFWFMGQVAQ